MRNLCGLFTWYTLTGTVFAQDLQVPSDLCAGAPHCPCYWGLHYVRVHIHMKSTWIWWSLTNVNFTFSLQLAALCFLGPQHLKHIPLVSINFLLSTRDLLRKAEQSFSECLVPCSGHSSDSLWFVILSEVTVFLTTTADVLLDGVEVAFFYVRSNWKLGSFRVCAVSWMNLTNIENGG